MAKDEHVAELRFFLLDQPMCFVERWNAWRKSHPAVRPDLSGVDLSYQLLANGDFRDVDLSEANLEGATLLDADFSGANLSYADLRFANAEGARFSRAYLAFTNFGDARLDNADFSEASLTGTYFLFNDLSSVRGLELARYLGHSSVTLDTIYRSAGQLPRSFLRGVGLPENFIEFVASLNPQEVVYRSCFLSYSSKDETFARRLHADLEQKGVRCWYAPKDLSIGAKTRPTLDEQIRLHDKLLLILSTDSVRSQWVEHEVESALDREVTEGRVILFPIRLDNEVMAINSGWPALVRRTRNIGDFCRWKNYDSYQEAFDKLLSALSRADLK
jgi:hypothetical protein